MLNQSTENSVIDSGSPLLVYAHLLSLRIWMKNTMGGEGSVQHNWLHNHNTALQPAHSVHSV